MDLLLLTDQEAAAYQQQLVPIYRDAFRMPPNRKEEAEVLDFVQSFPRHVHEEGFRMVVALQELTERVVGFAYGYANASDQFWYEQVAKALQPRMVTEWLVGSFRLVEMAVAPEVQGQGVGGLLHDRLLRGVPYRRAVLSTMAAETNAYWLYRKRGWRVLVDDLAFLGVPRRYRIMGLELGREGMA